jgi:hypothetical protein
MLHNKRFNKMADNVNNKNDNKEMAMAVNIGPGL